MGWFFLTLIAFLNTVPLFVLSILANLASVRIIFIHTNLLPHCVLEDCQLRPIPPKLATVFPRFLQFHFWCIASGCVCHFWFLLAHHDALAFAVSGCSDTISFGPRSCGTVLCVLGDLTAHHIHPYWRLLQFVPNLRLRVRKYLCLL